ncbi:class I SAM-dependent rRNA methyltransferase [bacterium]|nr:class I SAM-dependent rRNA methyltransferase [candidate division CSSED10-310 bacterium]
METLPIVRLSSSGYALWLEKHYTYPDHTIADAPTGLKPGDPVRIALPEGTVTGTGYFNTRSRLPLRVLSFDTHPIDSEFWTALLESALTFRRRFYPPGDSYRLVFGEADHIAGLIVDVFGSIAVIQITTSGLERYREAILDSVETVVRPDAIILACDSLPRKKEGLDLYRTVARGSCPGPFSAHVDGLPHYIDTVHGHKTGFFLDHRDNRAMTASLCSGKRILDLFCFSGALSIRAARTGAERITAVDIHDPSIQLGRQTACLNQCSDRIDFIHDEAFSFLRNTSDQYDLIFLDPPSFVRGSHRAMRNLANYIKINTLALNALVPKGILVTSCCSFHVSRPDFMTVAATSLKQAERTGRIFRVGGQSPDHPILANVEGTDYLKCFFIETDR